jgi:hypothetical protein
VSDAAREGTQRLLDQNENHPVVTAFKRAKNQERAG